MRMAKVAAEEDRRVQGARCHGPSPRVADASVLHHSVSTQEVGRRCEDPPPPPVSKATTYVLGEQARVTRKERDTVLYCIIYWINV